MKLKEIIVVEGKDDTTAIKRAVDADTIETNGSAINQTTIEKIRLAAQNRGVIIFTDPDYPGEKIRKTIINQVPGCKHAFIPKHLALPQKGKGIGVEHATPETIREALKDAHLMETEPEEQITRNTLFELGFISGVDSKEKREKIGLKLKIGYANGKQLHQRLMMFGISLDQFMNAVHELEEEVSKSINTCVSIR
ncbi:MAG: Ribonuclease [Bacillales bacterium]|jgi:ribonuclease M5|nr:Ribonuclease [Bacillales bacterium]